MSLYDDLNLPADASEAQIKAAHRKAAKRHHPDAGGKREDFERVQRAALILRDPVKREKYDRDGTVEDEATVDRELQGAMLIMSQVFEHVMSSEDIDHTDIITKVKTLLIKSVGEIRKQERGATKAIARLKRARKRLRHKGKGPDFLGSMIDDNITNERARLGDIGKNIASHERAIDMLGDFAWETEKPDWMDAAPIVDEIKWIGS